MQAWKPLQGFSMIADEVLSGTGLLERGSK
jgi:hypothetical protein